MGVNELWKLFREEGLMQEWSVETDGPGAQKAVAEQIEGDWPKSTHMAQVLRLSFQLRLYPCINSISLTGSARSSRHLTAEQSTAFPRQGHPLRNCTQLPVVLVFLASP